MKQFFSSLWTNIKSKLAKFTSFLYNAAAVFIIIGLLYFFYQIIIAGNILQSILSFCVGAVIAAVILSLTVISGRSEDRMYEMLVADLQKQVKEAENNYDLMRLSNLSLQKDKDNLNADIERQAGIIAEMVSKYNKLYVENDKLKVERMRSNISASRIDEKGKIVG